MSDRGRSPGRTGSGAPSKTSSSRPAPGTGSPTRTGSPGKSGSGSPARAGPSGTGAAGWPQGPGFDPARTDSKEKKHNTRLELPPEAYISSTEKSPFALRGNKFNTEGKPAEVEVNQYRMSKIDLSKKIYQYDVVLSPEPSKRGPVLKKIRAHPSFKAAFAKYNLPTWIFDGMHLAWAPGLVDRGEVRCQVDLDEGKTNARGDNKFHVIVRKTAEIDLSAIQGYLENKMSADKIETGLNFLDHLIRQFPSENMLLIKRQFYKDSEKGRPLMDGAVVEVHKGIYTSLRLSHNIARGGCGLALNADIANTCFWVGGQTMDQMACNFLALMDRKWRGLNPANLSQHLKPLTAQNGSLVASPAFQHLRRLRRLRFTIRHQNRRTSDTVLSCQYFTFDEKYGLDGANARTIKFERDGVPISVYDHYRTKYKIHLRYPNLPLIFAGKAGYIPMELAWIEPMQRYQSKLNPDQTAAMIKIAVTRPSQRRQDIESHMKDLQMANDPYLKQYGVKFDTQFTKTTARILAPPVVNFGQGNADPKFSGRWDLRGKKFFKQNTAPLQNWGFLVMNGCIGFPQLQQFSRTFKTTFMGHGGKCLADPVLLNAPGQIQNHAAEAVAWAHREVCSKSKGYTQLLFIVVKGRNDPNYERLKKSADCRFGILTQIVNSSAVTNNNGQYHSNVCLKVNAKLGGATSRTAPPWKSQGTYFPRDRPTMILGMDVSHASPGAQTPSVAALTMSVDRDATRYAALAETNGYRTEMVTSTNIHTMMASLVESWKAAHDGQQPKHIFYFRDGVAENQFAQVLEQEVKELRRFFQLKLGPHSIPKFTVIVATKRHHIRFFPTKGGGDRNGNPLPGTLVEKEVTHPFQFDFYMCSHVAIQGTARPVHYHVLIDEMNIPVNELQKMIYHQCYSYARSTTPVSLHPAVYYAHLAGSRARCHENVAASDGYRSGAKGHEVVRDKTAKGQSLGKDMRGESAPPLLPLGGKPEREPVDGEMRQRNFIRGTMWYI